MTPKLLDFIRYLRHEFIVVRVSAKTGWGKNELQLAFEEALSEALAKASDDAIFVDEKEKA